MGGLISSASTLVNMLFWGVQSYSKRAGFSGTIVLIQFQLFFRKFENFKVTLKSTIAIVFIVKILFQVDWPISDACRFSYPF